MDTTITNQAARQEPNMLPPQERLGQPGIHQPGVHRPGVRQASRKQRNGGIDRRLTLHSVHILALEAIIAAMPKQNGIDVAQVYAYIDARAGEKNSSLGEAAKDVAAGLMQSSGVSGIGKPKMMMKRAASWLVAVVAATAIVTAGFVGVAALVLKTGFGG